LPAFGRAMLAHWWLDPDATYLNHGTVGATPRAVLQAQQDWQRRIETAPARYVIRDAVRTTADDTDGRPRTAPLLIREVAATVAREFGARGEDLVFVDNTSTGVNAVLRSMRFQPGDEILLLDHAYGAVLRTAEFVARASGARVVTVPVPFPADADTPATVVRAIEGALTPRTRLAVLDHITSGSALVLPIAEMTACCRARGVPVLVDGAHVPGALALDIPAIGADWYVANLHKWAFVPRACAILWVAPQRRTGLHPAVISWGLDNGLAQEFDWTGTRDTSAVLAAPAAFAFMREVLGTQAMRTWNHGLVWRMAHALSTRWSRPFDTPESMIGTMAAVLLPARLQALGPQAAPALKDWLFHARRIESQVLTVGEHQVVRLAAQVYNDEADFERLADAIDAWPV